MTDDNKRADDVVSAAADADSGSGRSDSAIGDASTVRPVPDAPASGGGVPQQYGVGPLSIREVALVGIWALAFIVSFFPIYGRIGSGSSVWTAGIDWVLTIGLATAAVFLIVLRRFSPQGIRRVGSLGIDQFASVAFSVSSIIWLGIIWGAFVALPQTRVFLATWVVWVELILMLAGVVLTVVAPHLPVLGEDFRHRAETTSHRVAREARPVTPRPVTPRPAPATHGGHSAPAAAHSAPATHAAYAAPAAHDTYPAAPPTAAVDADRPSEDVDASAHTQIFGVLDDSASNDAASSESDGPVAEAGAPQAFWALSPEERDVLDDAGKPLFSVGPTAWALVIEDRAGVFVVRHEDGRVGYLHDTSGVTRG